MFWKKRKENAAKYKVENENLAVPEIHLKGDDDADPAEVCGEDQDIVYECGGSGNPYRKKARLSRRAEFYFGLCVLIYPIGMSIIMILSWLSCMKRTKRKVKLNG